MTTPVRRAVAFAAVGTLALAAPLLADTGAVPAPVVATSAGFAAVAGAAFLVDDGPAFDLFALPGERRAGRLYGLIGFALSAAVLGVLVRATALPAPVFVGTVLLLGYGNVGAQVARSVSGRTPAPAAGFAAAGFAAFLAGAAAAGGVAADDPTAVALFLAATGALLGALLRSVFYERDDPLVMLSIGVSLWVLSAFSVSLSWGWVAVAIGVTALVGAVSYLLDTASVSGMLMGSLLGLLTIVLGGYEWFAVIIAFFGVGGLSTKFRYERKRARGVAEANDGARGSGNVLGNSAVATGAVLAYAAPRTAVPVDQTLFLFAFAGSMAAAMSDTLSSEIGGVFDDPRLITTGERVDPGTDGAVTWQGELAGVAGAAVVAAIAAVLFGDVGVAGAAVVVAAGVAGMTVDSLLGATLEGEWVGNQGVNFLATLAGSLAGAGLAVLAGLP